MSRNEIKGAFLWTYVSFSVCKIKLSFTEIDAFIGFSTYMTFTTGLLLLTTVQALDSKRQSRLGYCNKLQRDVELTPPEVAKTSSTAQFSNLKSKEEVRTLAAILQPLIQYHP